MPSGPSTRRVSESRARRLFQRIARTSPEPSPFGEKLRRPTAAALVPRLAAPPPENPTERIPARTSVALGAGAATAFVPLVPLAATQTLELHGPHGAPRRERAR